MSGIAGRLQGRLDVHAAPGIDHVGPRKHEATVEDAIRVVIQALGESGLRGERTVLVGGGALDELSALKIGADVYCPDAAAAIEAAALLLAG